MKYFGWIFLFFIVSFIIPLGSRPMYSPWEYYGAIPAREMVESGSYATVPGDLAAPPMSHWVTTASYNLFGINNFSARLPSALAAGLTALFIALLIQQHLRDEKLAALSATVYMSFSLVFMYSGLSRLFMFSTMAIVGSMGAIFLALQEAKFNRRKFLLSVIAGLFSAVGVLSCGISAFSIPALTMLGYLLISRRLKELLFTGIPFIIFAALPVLPSFLCLLKTPELIAQFLHWNRHDVPYFAYPLIIIAGIFPVWVLIPAAMMTGKEAWKRLFGQPLCKFACCSIIIPIIYAFVTRNIHPAMLLVVFPSLAILVALGLQAYFNAGGHHRSFDWMLNLWATLLILSGLAEVILWFFPNIHTPILAKTIFKPVILLAFGVVSLIGGGALLYSLRGTWRSRLYLFFFSIAILPLGFSWCFNSSKIMPGKEFKSLVSSCNIAPGKSDLYARQEHIPALRWISGCKVRLLDEITIENNDLPTYLVLEKNDPILLRYSKNNYKCIESANFICVEIPQPEND